jgi:SAM-dependent methyltransferase
VHEIKSAFTIGCCASHLNTSLRYIVGQPGHWTRRSLSWEGRLETLVDDLLAAGYARLKVLDISTTALDAKRRHRGAAGEDVNWLAADVLQADLPAATLDIWHDRAVFHFFTGAGQRQRPIEQVLHALKPGAFAVVGTFGPQGPEQCSGLSVLRYSADELHHTFGEPFQLVDSRIEDAHHAPGQP